MQDLFFKTNNKAFSCRVSGILIKDDHILMQFNGNHKKLMFLGGHLKHGETSKYALIRELNEECNFEICVEQFLGWQEFCFDWEEMKTHQVCAFYLLSAKNFEKDDLIKKSFDTLNNVCFESNLIWIPKSELKHSTVYPVEVLENLNALLNGKLFN